MNENEFFSAIAKGDLQAIFHFIQSHPERWKEAANEGMTSLHFAPDAETVEFLISAGASLEAVDERGHSPFLRAVRNGKAAVVAVLIEHGCKISAKSINGNGALAIASLMGHLESAKQLIELGLRVNESHEAGYTSLHWACQEGHAEIAKVLISAGAYLEAVDEQGYSPFLRAVRKGKSATMAVLIEHGCKISAKSNNGNGALAIASLMGHLESAKQLIELGLRVNESHEAGYTSLHWACQEGHAEIAKVLISAGAFLEAVDKWGFTPFFRAVWSGKSATMAVLIEHGSDILAKSSNGIGALAIASQRGQLDSVRKLVEMGFSINDSDQNGYSSLHWACQEGHVQTAEYLISVGASLEAVDKWGLTPFLRAVWSGKSAVMAVLVERGCNIFAKQDGGHGALVIACQMGRLGSVKEIIELGFNVKEPDQNGYTSLHWACQEGQAETAEFLISAGASLEAVDKWKCTPFLRAACKGNLAAMVVLIDRGCNILAKNKDGNGALALASREGFLNVVQFLVQTGVSVNEAHQDKCTSLHWACREGRAETAKYLVSAGADIEATNRLKRTPLVEAEANKNYFVVDYLLNYVSETAAEKGRVEEGKLEFSFETPLSSDEELYLSDEEVPSCDESQNRFQEIYNEALKRGSVTVNRSRVIVSGQDGVGKSCLVDSLLNRPFEREKTSTEGAAVEMTHTAVSGWVATDSKDHLDPLIAQGVCDQINHAQLESDDSCSSPKLSCAARPSHDSDAKSEIAADADESGLCTPTAVDSAHLLEALGNNLKAVGIQAKMLTPNQQELVSTFLKNRPSEEDLSRESLGVRDIWDLGGQEIYLATHSALMPDNESFGLSMYMVVMDISKSLSDKAESFHRSSEGNVVDLTNELGWIRTNGDFPFYWFGSITAAHEETKKGDHWLGEDEEVDAPPVFAIGSHRDVLDSDKERFPNRAAVNKWLLTQGDLLEQLLKNSEFVKHIVLPNKHEDASDDENFQAMTHFVKRIFLIDNSVSGSHSPCKSVNEIRRRVDRMTSSYWRRQKKQPLFWVYLEILLFRWKEVMKTVVAKVDDIVKLSQHPGICNISSRDEVLVALKYLANVGAILYYPDVSDLKDFVFTSPTWVIKALSAFVTAAKPGPNMEPQWNTLKEKGVMSKGLMDYRLKQIRKSSDFATDEDLKEENGLIVRLLQLLDVITPVAGFPLYEFYVPSMLKPSFLYPRTYWERHNRSPLFPAPLIVIPMKLKFFPECLYFRLVTRFLKLYPKNPELSRHQCVFLVEDKDSTTEVEVELLYHSRGNWVALTILYITEGDVAKTSSLFLLSIREKLYKQMRKICYQGMGGFDYSICCQLEEAVHKDKHLDICLKNLPVLSTKKASKYCPKDEKLYNKFGKRVPVDPEDFSRINCWFGVQPINDQLRSIQGALPDVIDECLIRVVATLAESQWQKLALCLGRKGHAIPQYKEKSSDDSIRAAMVIEDWYAERSPSAATVIRLIRACEKCGIHGDHIASAYKEEL
ncbi:uncharacterized protein [Oscarella lobularis]|uniref:uncharacterized protein isoform X2 n=1 Tax=Oscarella lobularis TaxID=121494 RepID=UPI00331379C9